MLVPEYELHTNRNITYRTSSTKLLKPVLLKLPSEYLSPLLGFLLHPCIQEYFYNNQGSLSELLTNPF